MPTDADDILNLADAAASYATARDVANQLAGALWSRQRETESQAEQASLREERATVRSRLRTLQPGTAAVEVATDEWVTRLRALTS